MNILAQGEYYVRSFPTSPSPMHIYYNPENTLLTNLGNTLPNTRTVIKYDLLGNYIREMGWDDPVDHALLVKLTTITYICPRRIYLS